MNYVKLIRAACHGDGDNADSKVCGVGVYTCGPTRMEVTAPDFRLSIMRAPQGPYVPNYHDSSHPGIG